MPILGLKIFGFRQELTEKLPIFQEKNGKKIGFLAKYRFFFCGSNTHFFTSHLILLQKLTFFIGHFALQCREHGVPQNMALPKMGPIWRILAKNLIISLGDRISTNWAFMSLCLGWIVHIFTRICKFKLKISVVGT